MSRTLYTALLLLALALIAARGVSADCPGNLALNPGFEGEWYSGNTVGTSLSSYIAEDWLPWAVLGDQTQGEVGYNFEPEYKILQRSVLADGWYRVYAGERAQAFFSMYSTHTAGFYQRIRVPAGSLVTFSIWVQIYTGQEDLMIDGRYPISDLVQPMTEPTRSVKGPGDYRVYAGLDPGGGVPAIFGAPVPAGVIWSEPVLDMQTRGTDAAGKPVDEWVQLSVTARAVGDYVTVYTQGRPTYRTKHNDSYWDEACVQATGGATPTPGFTATPQVTPTPRPTLTPYTPPTPPPTVTPVPGQVPLSTVTPMPTFTASLAATPSPFVPATVTPPLPVQVPAGATPTLTRSPVPPTVRVPTITRVPVPTATVLLETVAVRSRSGLALLYLVNGALIGLVVWWIRSSRSRGSP